MNALKKARTEAGLSLVALSRKSGVAMETLSRLENNLRKPQMRTLEKIAGALGIPVSQLAGGLSVQHMKSSVEEAATQEKEAVLIATPDPIEGSIYKKVLRFRGESISSLEYPGGDIFLTLYKCPEGYRVYKQDIEEGTAALYPKVINPDTGKHEYSTYAAEDLVEDFPEFANEVGLYPVEDID